METAEQQSIVMSVSVVEFMREYLQNCTSINLYQMLYACMMLPVAVARNFSGSVAIGIVLSVYWWHITVMITGNSRKRARNHRYSDNRMMAAGFARCI